MIEDRVVGLKSREVYECPGSVTLIEAHKALERLVLTRDELRLKAALDQKYAELIYDAQWSAPLRLALDAFNAKLAERMTGDVRVKLVRGRAVVTGRARRSRCTMSRWRPTAPATPSGTMRPAGSFRSTACPSPPARRRRPRRRSARLRKSHERLDERGPNDV